VLPASARSAPGGLRAVSVTSRLAFGSPWKLVESSRHFASDERGGSRWRFKTSSSVASGRCVRRSSAFAADRELHAHLQSAYASGRVIYERAFPARRPSTVVRRLSEDPKLQRELARGIEELRAAGGRLQGRRVHRSRNATLFVGGLGLAVLFNPLSGTATRRWLRTRLSGSEETAPYRPNGSPAKADMAGVSSRPAESNEVQGEAGSGEVGSAENGAEFD
jgi:hypothetical protein